MKYVGHLVIDGTLNKNDVPKESRFGSDYLILKFDKEFLIGKNASNLKTNWIIM